MRVLLVGGGGREHALAWKISKSPEVQELLCAPGNAGIIREPKVTCLAVAAENVDALVALAQEQRPDLVVVGPEAPLVAGLGDRLEAEGIPMVGPRCEGARLEGSKAFAKELMRDSGIPTAPFEVFDDAGKALDYVRSLGGPCVVKADGLAAGKGVVCCQTSQEAERAVRLMMVDRAFGPAGDKVVVESFLQGEEASCIAITDGREIRLLAFSQDHKRVEDGDRGPNTGGMGAYSPTPVASQAIEEAARKKVFEPLLGGLEARGIKYRGILYAGLMIDHGELQVLEFNVRFGDPETQAILPRLDSDLVPALQAAASGSLSGISLEWDPRPAVCVVLASRGYPGNYDKGKVVRGLETVEPLPDVVVFHAGTRQEGGRVVTSGGRVLGVTALGRSIREAVERAYGAVDRIDFDGKTFRRDIAHRALERLG